jgi:GNAT superfamily N-acetyltransferase
MDWTNASATGNRERLHELALTGPPPGLVAFRGGQAVGWVSLGPRSSFERLEHSVVLAPIDDRPVWSIVCFVVGRKARRSGVAHRLLDAAIGYAREQGATALEAYPIDPGERVSAASAYRGTLTMFERAGFDVVARRRFNRTSPVRPIVRLDLG